MDLVTLAAANKYTRDKLAEAAVGGVDVEEYVNERVDQLINGASGTFDTLGEIETAVNNKVDKTTKINNKALSSNISLGASDVGAVPTSRTINGKSLSGNITLSAADVNALPSTTSIFSGNYNDLTNKPTIPSVDGLATTNYVDTAIAGVQFILNSSTEGSTKKFRITVDDSATLTAVEVVE